VHRAPRFCDKLGLNGSLRHVPGMIALADAIAPLEQGDAIHTFAT
jgi:hypothetical protein